MKKIAYISTSQKDNYEETAEKIAGVLMEACNNSDVIELFEHRAEAEELLEKMVDLMKDKAKTSTNKEFLGHAKMWEKAKIKRVEITINIIDE